MPLHRGDYRLIGFLRSYLLEVIRYLSSRSNFIQNTLDIITAKKLKNDIIILKKAYICSNISNKLSQIYLKMDEMRM